MHNYHRPEKRTANFLPGFWLGLVSGALAALVMLGRRGGSNNTTL